MSEWKSIDSVPKDKIILIAKATNIEGLWQYIHASYWADGWALPFDSERDEEGTPFIDDDEQPTHWCELPKPNYEVEQWTYRKK